MATVTNNVLIEGMSGKFGGSLVFRTMRGKTFMSAVARTPNKKKETEAQRNTRVNFREATEWARRTLREPEKKVYYQQRAKALKLPNAYTAAITDYMRKPKVIKLQDRDVITYCINKRGFAIREVKAEITEGTGVQSEVVVCKQNDTWFVSHKPDNGMPSSLTLVIADNNGRIFNSKLNNNVSGEGISRGSSFSCIPVG